MMTLEGISRISLFVNLPNQVVLDYKYVGLPVGWGVTTSDHCWFFLFITAYLVLVKGNSLCWCPSQPTDSYGCNTMRTTQHNKWSSKYKVYSKQTVKLHQPEAERDRSPLLRGEGFGPNLSTLWRSESVSFQVEASCNYSVLACRKLE